MSAESERPDRREVWAYIAGRTDLPMPMEITHFAPPVLALSFDSYEELCAWEPVLGVVERRKDREPSEQEGKLFSYFDFDGFLGCYHGYATCQEDAPVEAVAR
jgi:hypothetical protein